MVNQPEEFNKKYPLNQRKEMQLSVYSHEMMFSSLLLSACFFRNQKKTVLSTVLNKLQLT